jgi:AraC-like DNA-binding protein
VSTLFEQDATGSKPEFITTWESLAVKANYQPLRLARLCQVSLRTVQRHIRREYNITLAAWLNAARLDKARDRLASGERVKQVAFDLGYKQLSHFSRVFKERFGVSPRFLQGAAETRIRQSRVPSLHLLDRGENVRSIESI